MYIYIRDSNLATFVALKDAGSRNPLTELSDCFGYTFLLAGWQGFWIINGWNIES